MKNKAGFITLIIGIFFLLSPLWFYWLIHGSHERYLWIINGPYPLSHLGSGPLQLWTMLALVFIGMALSVASVFLYRKK